MASISSFAFTTGCHSCGTATSRLCNCSTVAYCSDACAGADATHASFCAMPRTSLLRVVNNVSSWCQEFPVAWLAIVEKVVQTGATPGTVFVLRPGSDKTSEMRLAEVERLVAPPLDNVAHSVATRRADQMNVMVLLAGRSFFHARMSVSRAPL